MACERTCDSCKHLGWDPDDLYCAHPKVLEVRPYGVSLTGPTIARICPAPDHPLWEERQPPAKKG